MKSHIWLLAVLVALLLSFPTSAASEIPALLWINKTDMLLSGPTGSDMYPSADEYVNGLFGAKGVFRAVTAGKGLRTITVDTKASPATEVFANDTLRSTYKGPYVIAEDLLCMPLL